MATAEALDYVKTQGSRGYQTAYLTKILAQRFILSNLVPSLVPPVTMSRYAEIALKMTPPIPTPTSGLASVAKKEQHIDEKKQRHEVEP